MRFEEHGVDRGGDRVERSLLCVEGRGRDDRGCHRIQGHHGGRGSGGRRALQGPGHERRHRQPYGKQEEARGELVSLGATVQTVPLKNGVMFVYTAEKPSSVTAVQATMARRNERMMALASEGEKARLCAECKSVRTAMASGKLTREVVNIEGGSLTLMTSDDPKIVAKIHAMVADKKTARTKS